MQSHELILFNLVLFVVVWIIAHYLSNIVPGCIRVSNVQYDSALLEKRKAYKKLFVAIYIVMISFFLNSFDELLAYFGEYTSSILKITEQLVVERQYLDAWLVFWGLSIIVYFAEYRLRTFYLKHNKTYPFSTLISFMIRASLFTLISLWIAHYVLGFNSVHLLVSTAVVTAVLGFSLKGILADLLAGIALNLSRAFLTSEWIEIPSLNVEGEVISSNWRDIKLRTAEGHLYAIPNSTITNTHFHNMSWPDATRRHSLSFILDATASPKQVEAVLIKAALSSEHVLNAPQPPQVLIKAYLAYGIEYQLRFWSQRYYERNLLESDVYKIAWVYLDKLGIHLPFNAGSQVALLGQSKPQ